LLYSLAFNSIKTGAAVHGLFFVTGDEWQAGGPVALAAHGVKKFAVAFVFAGITAGLAPAGLVLQAPAVKKFLFARSKNEICVAFPAFKDFVLEHTALSPWYITE